MSVTMCSVENICTCIVSIMWAHVYLILIMVLILTLSPTILCHFSMRASAGLIPVAVCAVAL